MKKLKEKIDIPSLKQFEKTINKDFYNCKKSNDWKGAIKIIKSIFYKSKYAGIKTAEDRFLKVINSIEHESTKMGDRREGRLLFE